MTESRNIKSVYNHGNRSHLPYKDGGQITCRLKIIQTPNGSRSVDCKIAPATYGNLNKIYGSKRSYDEAQKEIEHIPYEVMETIFEIDQYTKSMIEASSEGAWCIGKMISDFVDKFPNCKFINLSNCLNEWFKSSDKIKFGHSSAWISFYNFYKLYKLEDVGRVPYYFQFIDRPMRNVNAPMNKRIVAYLLELSERYPKEGSRHYKYAFLHWYKQRPSHTMKSNNNLLDDAMKELSRYDTKPINHDKLKNQITKNLNSAKVRKEIEAEY